MFYSLPPVGDPLRLFVGKQPQTLPESIFTPYIPHYFASGTAALAAAISAASRVKDIVDPEVILPAYGCPDLVSAALYAGTTPVLVDLEAGRPWMDPEQLSQRISERTIAICAVDLFGIPERIDRLRDIARDSDVVLIEDSAQFFPGGQGQPHWGGDMVVLSFGRGKPVSLLGGGALLVRDNELGRLVSELASPPRGGAAQRHSFRLKAMLYNQLIKPGLYWIPQQLPFLGLGETSYHPLNSMSAMDFARSSLLPANVMAYREKSMARQRGVAEMLAGQGLTDNKFIDLAVACGVSGNRRLLRYPILVHRAIREALFRNLDRKGLGPSRMYRSALPAVRGLESMFSTQGPFPAAEDFAARLLTLPVHGRVRAADIRRMKQVFEKTLIHTVP